MGRASDWVQWQSPWWWVKEQSPADAESFLSIFLTKVGSKVKDLSDSSPPCQRQTASCIHDQAQRLVNGGPHGSPMPGSTPVLSHNTKMMNSTTVTINVSSHICNTFITTNNNSLYNTLINQQKIHATSPTSETTNKTGHSSASSRCKGALC